MALKSQSIVTRVGLTAKEMRQIRALSAESGIHISRLIGDAVREKYLDKEKAA